ncbi:MAG TPA: helix-turn-helix domain-containing protein, partial [Chroococcales cyanobacterium]
MSRNKDLNESLKEERRQRILSGALRLFATRGLAATRIADIARETSMSQGLVYHYFKSKEEIFVELIRTAFQKLNAACDALEKMPLPPKEKISLAFEELLKGLRESEDAALF